MEARSERLGPNTLGIHSAQTDSNTRDQTERKDHRPGVQQHSGIVSERTFGSGQDDEDFEDLVQSGRSRGESWCSGYIIVRAGHY